MSDISITAANVIAGDNVAIKYGLANAAVASGKLGYKIAATGKLDLADNNSGTAEVRKATLLFLNNAAAGQPVAYMEEGDVTIGATLTAGVAYYLSGTAGGICPVADLTTGMYPESVGIAKSTSVLALKFNASGVAL